MPGKNLHYNKHMDYKNIANKLTNKLRFLKYAPLVLILALVMSTGTGFYLYYKEYRDFAGYKSALTQSKTTSTGQGPVVAFGDTRTGDSVHTQITDIIYGLDPAAVFHVGDAVADGGNSNQWQTFNQIEGKLIRNFNFYIAAGNHEKESQLFYDNFALPGNEKWYSVNYQGAHWAVLNSNLDLTPSSPQYAWLEGDLAQTREKAPFTAVVLHQSLYTSANHAADNVPYKQALIALFKKYGVDVVLSSHEHD